MQEHESVDHPTNILRQSSPWGGISAMRLMISALYDWALLGIRQYQEELVPMVWCRQPRCPAEGKTSKTGFAIAEIHCFER